MKKMIPVLCLSVFCFSILFTSCKKDEEPVIELTTAEKILGTWKMAAATIDPPQFTTGDDYMATLDECETDNTFTYEEGTTMKIDEGATKCNANTLQTQVGTYAFNPEETILSTNINGQELSSNIIELTQTQLVTSRKEQSNGQEVTLTFTYSKQE